MQRLMLAVAASASVAAAGPIAGAQGASSRAQSVVFGAVVPVVENGVSTPGFPVLFELSRNGRKVVLASIGLDLKCQTPGNIVIPDFVDNVPVKADGKFRAVQSVTRIPADGDIPAVDVSAKVTGRVNKARTQIKGTWQRKIVIYDPADATATRVLDTCDTGVLRFVAKN